MDWLLFASWWAWVPLELLLSVSDACTSISFETSHRFIWRFMQRYGIIKRSNIRRTVSPFRDGRNPWQQFSSPPFRSVVFMHTGPKQKEEGLDCWKAKLVWTILDVQYVFTHILNNTLLPLRSWRLAPITEKVRYSCDTRRIPCWDSHRNLTRRDTAYHWSWIGNHGLIVSTYNTTVVSVRVQTSVCIYV